MGIDRIRIYSGKNPTPEIPTNPEIITLTKVWKASDTPMAKSDKKISYEPGFRAEKQIEDLSNTET